MPIYQIVRMITAIKKKFQVCGLVGSKVNSHFYMNNLSLFVAHFIFGTSDMSNYTFLETLLSDEYDGMSFNSIKSD